MKGEKEKNIVYRQEPPGWAPGKGKGAGNNNCRETVINGVDVSNPTCVFTSQEWEDLCFNGGRD
eukprot:1542465-Ditylum_brightwellii.AAC.2